MDDQSLSVITTLHSSSLTVVWSELYARRVYSVKSHECAAPQRDVGMPPGYLTLCARDNHQPPLACAIKAADRREVKRKSSHVPDQMRSDSDGGQMLDSQSHRSDRELEETPRRAGPKRSRIASSTARLRGRADNRWERRKRKGRTVEKVEGRREKKEEEKRRRKRKKGYRGLVEGSSK